MYIHVYPHTHICKYTWIMGIHYTCKGGGHGTTCSQFSLSTPLRTITGLGLLGFRAGAFICWAVFPTREACLKNKIK